MPKGKKKEEVSKEEEVKEVEEKVVPYKVKASFKAFDEIERVRVKIVFTGEGDSVKEALDSITNDETGEGYPEGINALVNIKVTRGNKVIDKNVAPHRARQILEQKNTAIFNRIFNGI